MNSIINPMWFYWIGVVDGLKTLGEVFLFLGICAVVGFTIAYFVAADAVREYPSISDGEKMRLPFYKKAIPIAAVIALIGLITTIFVPSKETMIEMMIARYATYDNAEWTLDALRSAVDYVVNAIQTLNGG